MRLTAEELSAITDCAARHFGAGATVRLFGSRVRDDLRGGDIDLHVIADSPERATSGAESAFRKALESRIGDRRIDVLLLAPGEAFRPIDEIAIGTGVPLTLGDPAPCSGAIRPIGPADRSKHAPDIGRPFLPNAQATALADSLAAGRDTRRRLLQAWPSSSLAFRSLGPISPR